MSSTNFASVLTTLVKTRDKLTRYRSHADFLSSCIEHDVIPKGMTVGFGKAALPTSEHLHTMVDRITRCASKETLITCRDTYKSLINKGTIKMHETLFDLQQRTTYHEFEAVLRMQCRKSKSGSKLHRKKQKKLQQLLEQKKASAQTPPVKHKGRRFKIFDSSAATDNPTAKGKADENKLVINLSNIPMTEAQERLLTLGPKFCPTPRSINTDQLSEDVREGCRRVRLQEWHHTSDTDDSADEEASAPKFYKPTGFMPPAGHDKTLDAYCNILQSRTDTYSAPKFQHDNLTTDEHRALKELRMMVNRREIRISTADKGGAVVIQDTEAYIAEAKRQLSKNLHYKKLTTDPTT